MVGIGGALIVLQVASDASRARETEIVVDMTVGALPRWHRVPAGERKSNRGVIEGRVQPIVGSMAIVTGCGESSARVIGIGGRLEVGSVAGITLSLHRLKLACRRTLMTGVAVYGSMRSGQRKAVVVLLDLHDRNLPAAYGMALLAVRAKLSAVNVGMAVLAPLSYIGEHRLDVALRASHGLMHTAQRISGLIMVEFRNGTDRTPGRCRVAVLARYVQVLVRTVCSCCSLCSRARSNPHKNNQQPDPIVHAPHA